jgi:inward rectifier potassium channel
MPEPQDLGFGSVVAQQSRGRLLNRDGTFNVRREGLSALGRLTPYHLLLTISWPRFLGLLALAYVAVNALFAWLYLLCGPGALAPTVDSGIASRALVAFFFSVETFATIGYGHIVPVGPAAHTVMAGESLASILLVALATGIIFARFARPTARIRFSRHALIAPYQGGTAFEFRIANARANELIEVECKVLLGRFERVDGRMVRVFHPLALVRERVTFFPLAWTVVHPIDAQSPLYGETPESLGYGEAEFLILLTGVDEGFATRVHARSSYRAEEVVWDARFRSVFNPPREDGVLSIDVGGLDAIERLRT